MMLWPKENLLLNGEMVETIAPIIISASRATDIPAFYAKSFVDQFRKGYLFWANPFNGNKIPISLNQVRLIVFWTKNPNPIIPYLPIFDNLQIDYYFNYTLNSYENEGLEKNLPTIQNRIKSFISLSEKIGKEKVNWRFDPIILLKNQLHEEIIQRISELAERLHPYTEKLVFSFIDTHYRKVQRELVKSNIEIHPFIEKDKLLFASKLSRSIAKYHLNISTCAEYLNLEKFGIKHNKCIDDELITRIFTENEKLIGFINLLKSKNALKDKGQREFCKCIPAKDIGRYNTCKYGCTYCYAGHYNPEKENVNLFV